MISETTQSDRLLKTTVAKEKQLSAHFNFISSMKLKCCLTKIQLLFYDLKKFLI